MRGNGKGRPGALKEAACAIFIWLLALAAASPAQQQPERLSVNAVRQIAALQAEKAARTPAQLKMDSQLVYAVKIRRQDPAMRAIPALKAGVEIDAAGNVLVDIRATTTAELASYMEALGSHIIYRDGSNMRARVPIDRIEQIAARPELRWIMPYARCVTNQSNTSQGDATHRAAAARTNFNVDGTGIRIGILSDGVDSLAALQGSNDLPAGVTVVPGQAGSGDEGSAMLEVVHDIAPGAQLYFGTAFNGINSFANNIRTLRTTYNCDIIIDDVTYFIETPFHQGDPAPAVSTTSAADIIQAVNDVVTAGAMYFSSAANGGNLDAGRSGTWEGNFLDGGPAGAPLPAGRLHDFGGGQTFDVLTSANNVGRRIDLWWADPLGGSNNDYDLYLLDNTGTTVLFSSTNPQSGTQDSQEEMWLNPGPVPANSRIVILQHTGAAARFLHLATNRGRLSIATSGETRGHNSIGGISVAATPAAAVAATCGGAAGPFPNPFNATNVVECFSSDGPRRVFFNALRNPIAGGLDLQKPDFTAADGVACAAPGFNPFFGTSAAAPHAGAIAALIKSLNSHFSNTQIIDLMKTTAIDIAAAGFDRDAGSGIVMAFEALSAASALCVGRAGGVPPYYDPPCWWLTSPPEPVYFDKLDDPRWVGAAKVTYGDGTGDKADFRALHDNTYLYLSWRAFVAPASAPDQNTLYFGYPRPAGDYVIIKISLTTLSTVTDSTSLTLEAFVRNLDGTQGAAVVPDPEIQATARVWVDSAVPGSWAVQVRMPLSALAITSDRFKLWYDLLAGTPTVPVASYTWPRSGVEIDGGMVGSPHPAIYPDPVLWNWFRKSTGQSDLTCTIGGVSLYYTDVGTTNVPASQIKYSAATPHPVNTFYARPTNNTGADLPAGAVQATFRIANWGSVPGNWEQGVPVDVLWATIPGGSNIATSGVIPNGVTADASNEAHFDWTVADPDLADFISGVRWSHQCVLVTLSSTTSPGVTFINDSIFRNMDVVSASTFGRDALLSIKGLTPISAQPRDVYVYVETQNMPTEVKASAKTTAPPMARENPKAAARRPATYKVHVYYDSGKAVTIGSAVRPILRYQTSFGYTVNHEGDLQGWRHQFKGEGLIELAPGWYKIAVPNNGSRTVTTEIEAVELRRWSLSLELGPNLPLGSSGNLYKGGFGGGVDLEYLLNPSTSLELFLGRDGLPGKSGVSDLTVTHFSLSAKVYLLPGHSRPFVTVGAGAYILDPGSTELGYLVGAGVQHNILPTFAVEATAKLHKVATGAERLQFGTAQLGLRLRF